MEAAAHWAAGVHRALNRAAGTEPLTEAPTKPPAEFRWWTLGGSCPQPSGGCPALHRGRSGMSIGAFKPSAVRRAWGGSNCSLQASTLLAGSSAAEAPGYVT